LSVETIPAPSLPESRWADVGGPVHYREWPGPGEGRTFVCLHRLGGSHLDWAQVAAELSLRGRTLALDLAGFGLTPPAERGTDVGANWRLLDGFLRALELPPVTLVGSSMGGMISLVQAAHSPASTNSLILVDTAFPRPTLSRGRPSPKAAAAFSVYSSRRLGEWVAGNRTRRLGPEAMVRRTFRILVRTDPDTVDPDLLAAHVDMARIRAGLAYPSRAFADAARSVFRAQVSARRYRALVQRLRQPALVIHGAQDPLIPVTSAREAASQHPNWKLVVFPDLGHVPQMEAPDRWLATVEAWLDEQDENGKAV
jgi:pimeloyl-ACP methyl ester carboxylesterase